MACFAKVSVVSLGTLVLIVGITAGSRAAQGTTPKVEKGRYVATVSIAGKDNFDAYCAVCHGKDAKGNGPAAPAMKAPVPDLTTIATRHGGTFNFAAVEYVIRGTGKMATPAHGVQEMPIWGDVFDPTRTDRAGTTLRVKNLVRYLESIQQQNAPGDSAKRR